MGFASFLSSAGGASLIGGGMGLTSSLLQHEQNKSLNRQQFQYNKTMYQNRHQWETEDLEKSGLNPAISANSGATQGTSAGQSAQNPFGTASSIMQNLLNASAIQANTEKTQAETASILKNSGWIDKKTQAEIEEAYSRMLLNRTTSAKNAEETRKTKKGLPAQLFGTDGEAGWGTIASLASAIPALGFGYRAYKGIKALRDGARIYKNVAPMI